jgi:hypothetical protein
MTDLDLRAACAAIVANIREQERQRLIAEAEAAIYGADWFKRGVRRHLRLVGTKTKGSK